MTHRHLLAFTTTLLAFLFTTSTAWAGGSCPKDFKHERTGILHKSPKKRLFNGKSVGGRVCIHMTKPGSVKRAGGGDKLVCPIGYQHERAGIFQDSPKKRLLNDGNIVHWQTMHKYIQSRSSKRNSERRTCLAVVKPGTDAGKVWRLAPTKNNPMVTAHGATFDTGRFGNRVRRFPVLETVNVSGDSACNNRCQTDQRCVVAQYANKKCTLHTQFDYRRGDRMPSHHENKVTVGALKHASRTSKVSFKKSVFWGTLDYGPIYTTKQSYCPDSSVRPLPSAPRDLGLPKPAESSSPRECIGSQGCGVEVVRPDGRTTTYYRAVPKWKKSGAKCTIHKLKRQLPNASGGKA
jgi:hypothetical protein